MENNSDDWGVILFLLYIVVYIHKLTSDKNNNIISLPLWLLSVLLLFLQPKQSKHG